MFKMFLGKAIPVRAVREAEGVTILPVRSISGSVSGGVSEEVLKVSSPFRGDVGGRIGGSETIVLPS
jgi:hypothetical protein